MPIFQYSTESSDRLSTKYSILILLIISQALNAQQNLPIGNWQTYFAYNLASTVEIVDEEIWVGTSSSYLMVYDLEDRSFRRQTNIQGFAEPEVTVVRYNSEKDWTLIAYENANIDLIKGNRFLNIPDVKDKIIPGDKRIYEIHFIGDLAYVSTGFGILVINIEREEIKDTYYIGEGGAPIQVLDVSNNEDQIFAATEEGLYYADLNNPNLANFNNWNIFDESDGLPIGKATSIHNDGVNLLTTVDGVLYRFENETWNFVYDANEGVTSESERWEVVHLTGNPNELVMCENLIIDTDSTEARIGGGRVNLYEQQTNNSIIYDGAALQRPQESKIDDNGRIWIADGFVGLVEINENGEQQYRKRIAGPRNNSSWALEIQQDGFWVAPAKLTNTWTGQGDPTGAYYYENGDWSRFEPAPQDKIKDIVDIAIHPNGETIYFASYNRGLIELNGENVTVFDTLNSSIQVTAGDVTQRVSGLAFDQQGNLWMSNYGAPEPISVYTANGEWESYLPKRANGSDYSMNPTQKAERGFTEIVIDSYNNKWFVVRNVGVVVSTCDDPLSCAPGDYRLFKYIDFFNGMPTNDANCLAVDLEDEIWLGTDDGIAVFFCTSNPLNENCEFSKPIIPLTEEEGAYLLQGVRINTIAVDGADRKWIGTDQGIQVLSPDGKETIQTFNLDNSPLISNIIRDIVINGQTGEVFIATDKGVMSYRADALATTYTQPSEVLAYPNPVKFDYDGPIAIKGLAQNASIKITDVSGNLVYETEALGGQAIWDGNDYLGRRATTGVYLVLSSNEDGTQTIATKLFLVSE